MPTLSRGAGDVVADSCHGRPRRHLLRHRRGVRTICQRGTRRRGAGSSSRPGGDGHEVPACTGLRARIATSSHRCGGRRCWWPAAPQVEVEGGNATMNQLAQPEAEIVPVWPEQVPDADLWRDIGPELERPRWENSRLVRNVSQPTLTV